MLGILETFRFRKMNQISLIDNANYRSGFSIRITYIKRFLY